MMTQLIVWQNLQINRYALSSRPRMERMVDTWPVLHAALGEQLPFCGRVDHLLASIAFSKSRAHRIGAEPHANEEVL